MPRKAIQQIIAWSFSRWSTYDDCPLKAKLKFIDKIQEPGNEAMARGSKIHKLAEKYAKGRLVRLPAELDLFDKEFEALKEIPTGVMVE